jgi:hypothetical protein
VDSAVRQDQVRQREGAEDRRQQPPDLLADVGHAAGNSRLARLPAEPVRRGRHLPQALRLRLELHLTDITPLSSTGTLGNNPFTTVNGSKVVTVTHTAHGRNVGDTEIFAGAATFNNVTMNGTFVVNTVIDVNNYTVIAATTANANGSGGGAAVTFQYEIPVGTELGAFGQGWGVGGWGSAPGVRRAAPRPSSSSRASGRSIISVSCCWPPTTAARSGRSIPRRRSHGRVRSAPSAASR